MSSNTSTRVRLGLAGNSSPKARSAGLALGLLTGLVAGLNLLSVAALLACAVLHVNTRRMLIGLATGIAGSWLGAGLFASIGRLLIGAAGLEATVASSPWCALAGFDRFAIVGACAVSAVVAAVLLARLKYRDELSGGEAAPVFRPMGSLVAVAVIAMVVACGYRPAERLAVEALMTSLAQANRADVTADEVRLSIATGRLEFRNLGFADPLALDRDWLRLARVHARVEPWALLSGRLVASEVRVDGVMSNVARAARAQSNSRTWCAEPNGGSEHAPMTHVTELEASTSNEAVLREEDADRRPLEENLSQAQSPDEWFTRLLNLTDVLAQVGKLDERMQANTGAVLGCSSSCAPRRTRALPADQPTISIARIVVEGLPADWGCGPREVLELRSVTSDAQCATKKTEMTLVVPRWSSRLEVEFDLAKARGRHAVDFTASGWPLRGVLSDVANEQLRVARGSSHINVRGHGWFTMDQLHLPMSVDSRDLVVQLRGEQPVAGLEHWVWNEGLERIDRLRGAVLLAGHRDALRIEVDRATVVSDFQHQLAIGGQADLAQAIARQLSNSTADGAEQGLASGEDLPSELSTEIGPVEGEQPQVHELPGARTAGRPRPDAADNSSLNHRAEYLAAGNQRSPAQWAQGSHQPVVGNPVVNAMGPMPRRVTNPQVAPTPASVGAQPALGAVPATTVAAAPATTMVPPAAVASGALPPGGALPPSAAVPGAPVPAAVPTMPNPAMMGHAVAAPVGAQPPVAGAPIPAAQFPGAPISNGPIASGHAPANARTPLMAIAAPQIAAPQNPAPQTAAPQAPATQTSAAPMAAPQSPAMNYGLARTSSAKAIGLELPGAPQAGPATGFDTGSDAPTDRAAEAAVESSAEVTAAVSMPEPVLPQAPSQPASAMETMARSHLTPSPGMIGMTTGFDNEDPSRLERTAAIAQPSQAIERARLTPAASVHPALLASAPPQLAPDAPAAEADPGFFSRVATSVRNLWPWGGESESKDPAADRPASPPKSGPRMAAASKVSSERERRPYDPAIGARRF